MSILPDSTPSIDTVGFRNEGQNQLLPPGKYTDLSFELIKKVPEQAPLGSLVESYLLGLHQFEISLEGQAERSLFKTDQSSLFPRLDELERLRKELLSLKQRMGLGKNKINKYLLAEGIIQEEAVPGKIGGGIDPIQIVEESETLYLLAGKIGLVDHDLRNALTGFSGFLEFLRREESTEIPRSPLLHRVDSCLSNLSEYVSQVVPDYLKGKISHQNIAISSLAANFQKYLSSELVNSDSQLEIVKVDPSLEAVAVDYSRILLKPLITNIGSDIHKAFIEKETRLSKGQGTDEYDRQNKVTVEFVRAEDFRDENGQQVKLPEAQAAKLLPGQKYIFIVIRDTGVGFEVPELLETGFKSGVSGFEKLSQSDKVGGTGRGMAGHQEILEKHFRGTFILRNRVDVRGACTIIALPCIEAASTNTPGIVASKP